MWQRSHAASSFLYLVAFAFISVCSAAVIDRVAVIVGNSVITQTEVIEEVRLSEFESGQPLDLSAKARRAAAERLVDQQLLRNEIQISGFTPPPASEADALLGKFRQEHFSSVSAYQAALAKYGITEDELKQHLLWELTVIQFTDVRFRMGLPATSSDSADRVQPGAAVAPALTVDQQMDAWLKDARGNTRIVFKQEAFQ
jgi:hypothetical protein